MKALFVFFNDLKNGLFLKFMLHKSLSPLTLSQLTGWQLVNFLFYGLSLALNNCNFLLTHTSCRSKSSNCWFGHVDISSLQFSIQQISLIYVLLQKIYSIIRIME